MIATTPLYKYHEPRTVPLTDCDHEHHIIPMLELNVLVFKCSEPYCDFYVSWEEGLRRLNNGL